MSDLLSRFRIREITSNFGLSLRSRYWRDTGRFERNEGVLWDVECGCVPWGRRFDRDRMFGEPFFFETASERVETRKGGIGRGRGDGLGNRRIEGGRCWGSSSGTGSGSGSRSRGRDGSRRLTLGEGIKFSNFL